MSITLAHKPGGTLYLARSRHWGRALGIGKVPRFFGCLLRKGVHEENPLFIQWRFAFTFYCKWDVRFCPPRLLPHAKLLPWVAQGMDAALIPEGFSW